MNIRHAETPFHPAFATTADVAVSLSDTRHKGVTVKGVVTTLRVWVDRYKQRRDLASLPAHLLRDIGIDEVDALREAMKPFWRI